MMRRTAIALIAVAGVLTTAAAPAAKPQPTPATSATGDNDLRCMLVASALSQNKEEQARNLSRLMVFYYLGRLDARRPGLNLGPALQAEVRSTNPTELQAIGQRCVAAISGRAKALEAVSARPAGAPPAAAPAMSSSKP